MNTISAPETTQEPEKRTWHYVQQPSVFEMAPCTCGNHQTQWSEFAKHLWCDKCESDFIPAHAGIFSGPIQVKVAAMLGVRFDRIIIASGKLEKFDTDANQYISES